MSGAGRAGRNPSGAPDVSVSRLFELFEEYRDRPFLLVEPGGNQGDQLIYRGAERLARLAGVDAERWSHAEFMEREIPGEAVVYLHGSGGYNPWWSGTPMRELARAAACHPGVVIQGPASFHDDPAFLRREVLAPLEGRRPARVVLFARERRSFDALRPLLPAGVELALDHDTALAARVEPPPAASRGHTLYALREDLESLGFGVCLPLAARGDPVELQRTFEGWWRLHAEAGRIVTDRLHSAIAGSLLGRPTTLLPNRYFKNRAVWEHSLAARGVAWADEPPLGRAARALEAARPVAWLLSRRRVRRRLQRARGLRSRGRRRETRRRSAASRPAPGAR